MTADIIAGPWKKTDQTERELEKAQLLSDCDSIASDCMVSVLHTIVEHGMAPEDPDDENLEFVMFLSEVLKSITYASVEIDHPFQDIINLLIKKEVLPNNDKQFYIDYHLLKKTMDTMREYDNPEKDPA